VADLHRRIITVVQAQVTNDLLRRPLLLQQGQHRLPQRVPAGEQTRLRPPGTVERPFLCHGRPVGVASTVLVDLTADR
jgi:hypothetical protein